MGSLVRKAARTKYKAARGDAWTKKQQRGAIHAAKVSRKAADPMDPAFLAAAEAFLEAQDDTP